MIPELHTGLWHVASVREGWDQLLREMGQRGKLGALTQ